MAFMEPSYSDEKFVEITDKHGERHLTPFGYESLEDGEEITAVHEGKWFCQLSADGYMDQTDWSGPFETEDEARDYIRDTYDVDPDTGDELDAEDDAEDAA